jgi:uncharacterized protein (UPF0335 family)
MRGHNSGSFYGGMSAEQLTQFIERIERLEEEKKNIADDIKEIYAEAKGGGFDTKTMRQILKIRKIEAAELEEQEYLLDTYKRALGMLPELDDDADMKLEKTRLAASKKIISYMHLIETAETFESLSDTDNELIESLRSDYNKFGNAAIISDDQLKWLQDIANKE